MTSLPHVESAIFDEWIYDFEFWWSTESPIRAHIESSNCRPLGKSLPEFNQYIHEWSKMGCTHINAFRPYCMTFDYQPPLEEYIALTKYAKENYSYDPATGNSTTNGTLAATNFYNKVHKDMQIKYFRTDYWSEDHIYLLNRWFAVTVWHVVTKKWRDDLMDNKVINTYNRWSRISGHATCQMIINGKVCIHDSNEWSPYEIYETPEDLMSKRREYGDFYRSVWVWLPVERIYRLPSDASDKLYRMYSMLSYRYNNIGSQPWNAQTKRFYDAMSRIAQQLLIVDIDNCIALLYSNLVIMGWSKKLDPQNERSMVLYNKNKITEMLWKTVDMT